MTQAQPQRWGKAVSICSFEPSEPNPLPAHSCQCLPANKCGHEALQCCSEDTGKLHHDSMCGSLQPMIHESLAKVLSVPVDAVRGRLTQELKDSQEKSGKVSYHAIT